MFPKSSRVRFSRRLSTLRGVVLFPAAPTLPTISNRTGSPNMVCNVVCTQSEAVPPRQPSHSATSSALVGVPMFRSLNPQKHVAALAHSTRPTPLATLPSPAPNHPPFVEVGALRA